MRRLLALTALVTASVTFGLASTALPVSGQQVTPASTSTPTATASPTGTATPVATTTPGSAAGSIVSGSVPVSGFGLITWGGGTRTQLVAASGCTEPTLTFWFTDRGGFVTFVPGTSVSAVNAAFEVLYGSAIPTLTPVLARCTDPGALDGYRNATYRIGNDVQLVDGASDVPAAPGSASMISTRIFGNAVFGDLTGDGRVDVGFLLTQDRGGSGTFYYVVVAMRTTDGGWSGTNGVLLGDRIAPQTTEYRSGTLIVNYADRKPGEPFSTPPSVGMTKYLRVVNGALVEVAAP